MLQVRVMGRPKTLFYGWIIVAAGFVSQVLNSGLGFQGFGTFIIPLQHEFGWTKTQLSAARAFMQVENGLLGPVEGFLIDRFGPRLIMAVGTSIFGLGLVLFGMVHNIWQYYAVFLVMALGTGLGGFLVMVVAINHWFRRKRTFAMSLATMGLGFGGVVVVPLLVWAQESFGWRDAAIGSGIAVWVLGIPTALLIRRTPERYGVAPDGDTPSATAPARGREDGHGAASSGQYDYTLKEAVRTRAFWLIALSHSLSIMVISAASVHQFAHMEEGVGISKQAAATVVAVLSITNMVGRLVGGVLGDRMNKRHLAAIGMLGNAGSLFIFAFAGSLGVAMVYGVLYGFFWGMRGPMIDSLRADYFGRAHFGKISGTSSLLTMPGSVIGPVFAGIMADALGNYQLGFVILASVSCLGFALILLATQPRLPARLRTQQAETSAGPAQ